MDNSKPVVDRKARRVTIRFPVSLTFRQRLAFAWSVLRKRDHDLPGMKFLIEYEPEETHR